MKALLLVVVVICATEARTLKKCQGNCEMETKRSSCKIQIMGDCLDYLLENNSNQDGSVGKRSSCKIQIMGDCLDYLLENNSNQDGSVGRRDVEEGLLGSSDDEQWLVGGETPGRRCANLFDDGCTNGGLVGSTDDENWLSGGGTPGKRGLYRIGGYSQSEYPSASRNNAIQYLLRGM